MSLPDKKLYVNGEYMGSLDSMTTEEDKLEFRTGIPIKIAGTITTEERIKVNTNKPTLGLGTLHMAGDMGFLKDNQYHIMPPPSIDEIDPIADIHQAIYKAGVISKLEELNLRRAKFGIGPLIVEELELSPKRKSKLVALCDRYHLWDIARLGLCLFASVEAGLYGRPWQAWSVGVLCVALLSYGRELTTAREVGDGE